MLWLGGGRYDGLEQVHDAFTGKGKWRLYTERLGVIVELLLGVGLSENRQVVVEASRCRRFVGGA